jgi:acyl dehydratase
VKHATGDAIPSLQSPTIQRLNIAYMSVAMGDPNPIHMEDDFARQAGMPGVIAHGTFPIGYVGAALTRTFGFDAVKHMKVDLTAPVFPGDELSTEIVVKEAVAIDDGERLTLDLRIVKADGTLAGRGEAQVVA